MYSLAVEKLYVNLADDLCVSNDLGTCLKFHYEQTK